VNSSTIFTSPPWIEVVLVPLEQLLGLERHGELVHQVRCHVVVDVLDAEGRLDLLDARL
jgi:hypothetical protein